MYNKLFNDITFTNKILILFFTVFTFFILFIYYNVFFQPKTSEIKIEDIRINSIYTLKLFKKDKKIVAIEYCTFEQVIKVGLIDTTAIMGYLKISPYAGSDLFIYNCASCHYAYPSFSESIKGEIPDNKAKLKNALCQNKHIQVDSVSCKSLNDFELFLITKYINGDKN